MQAAETAVGNLTRTRETQKKKCAMPQQIQTQMASGYNVGWSKLAWVSGNQSGKIATGNNWDGCPTRPERSTRPKERIPSMTWDPILPSLIWMFALQICWSIGIVSRTDRLANSNRDFDVSGLKQRTQ